MFQPFHLVMRASDHARAVERPRGGGIERVDGERRLARAGNAGDAGEGAQRDLRIDIAQVIGPRALYRQELAGTLAAADRDRHLAPPRQIIAGDAGFIADDVVERAFGHHLAAMQARARPRSEENTSELQSLMRISHAVFCLNNKNISYPSMKL